MAMVVLMAVVGNGYVIAEEYYELEKNSKGEFRAVGQKTEIRVEEKALPYESFFQEAIENPGVPVTVQEKVMPLETKLFKNMWFIQKKEIVYNDSTKLIDFADNSELKEEQGPTILFWIILFSVLFMFIAKFFFFLGIDKGLNLFVFGISMANISSLFLFEELYHRPALGFAFSWIVCIVGLYKSNKKIYIFGSVVYYLSILWMGYYLL